MHGAEQLLPTEYERALLEAEVAQLFTRVEREQKRLDLLVNVMTGTPVKSFAPFWT